MSSYKPHHYFSTYISRLRRRLKRAFFNQIYVVCFTLYFLFYALLANFIGKGLKVCSTELKGLFHKKSKTRVNLRVSVTYKLFNKIKGIIE